MNMSLTNLKSVYFGSTAVIKVYPNKAIISGPKKYTFSDNRRLYSVEDVLESRSWTGSASMENQGIKYKKLLVNQERVFMCLLQHSQDQLFSHPHTVPNQ